MGLGAFQNLAETVRLVPGLQPQTINGSAVASQFFNMGKYEHLSALVYIGTHGAAMTITVTQSQDSAGTGETAIPFDYYSPATTGNDVLGARNTAAASGVATDGATANIIYAIELNAAQLASGYNWVRVKLSAPGVNTLVAVIPALTTARYAGQPANMPSALV